MAKKTCKHKHCGREIEWNVDLQRYEHVDTHYDACGGWWNPQWPDATRAEPRDG